MEAKSFLSKWPAIKARIDEHQVKLRHKRIKSIPSLLGSLKEGTEALVTKGARPDEHGIGQLRARECEYNSVASQIEKLFSSSSEKTRELLSEIGADAEMALKVCREALYRRAEPIPNLPRLTAPQTERSAAPAEWPPDDGWHFRPGAYAYRGETHALNGKLLKLLEHLATSRFPSTAEQMAEAMDSDAKEASSIRTDLTNLRNILRENHKLPSDSDPIPCTAKGEPSVWELDIDCRHTVRPTKKKPKPSARAKKSANKRRFSVRRNGG